MGAIGPQQQAPDRSQWALPGLNSKCQITVTLADLDRKPQIAAGTAALAGPNRKCQRAAGTTGPQQQVPDRRGHQRTTDRWAGHYSTASARSQWAPPDLSSKCQIAVGAAGPQPQAPDGSGHYYGPSDRSVHYQTSTASARSQWAPPDHRSSARSQWALPDLNAPQLLTFLCQLETLVAPRCDILNTKVRIPNPRTRKQSRKPKNSRPWQRAPYHGMKTQD